MGDDRRAWTASVLADPEKWGFHSFRVQDTLKIAPGDDGNLPVNTEGSTMTCREASVFRIRDGIRLVAR